MTIIILLTLASITMMYWFSVNSQTYEPAKVNFVHKEIEDSIIGKASWYDYCLEYEPGPLESLCNQWSKTHNTAASRNLPRYTKWKVTNLANNKSTIVYINDYGPDVSIHPDRIIDLSSHAFNEISNTNLGIINVKITSL